MTNTKPTPDPIASADSSNPDLTPAASTSSSFDLPPTPGRCFRGALISGVFATGTYFLTRSIIQVLAGVPLPTKSRIAANIAVAVRTLIIGMSTMATAIFAVATLGLVALGIQLLLKSDRSKSE